MVDKLDACPFCGRDGQIANTEWGSFAAGCLTENCPAEKGAYDFVSAETAAAHWNTRATPANGEQVERARDTIRDALMDSQYMAGVTAGWNAAQDDDPETALAALRASRDGHLSGFAEAKAIIAAGDPTEDARSRVKVLEEFVREYVRVWEAGAGTVYLIDSARALIASAKEPQ